MTTNDPNRARLSFRLPSNQKAVIERAANALGQSVSDYAIATLVSNSQAVLQQSHATALSIRDRAIFLAMLDDAESKPNSALAGAATRYRKRFN